MCEVRRMTLGRSSPSREGIAPLSWISPRGRTSFLQTLFRCVGFVSMLASAACAQSHCGQGAARGSPRDEPSVAFGPTIVDLAFTFNDEAKRSLEVAPGT